MRRRGVAARVPRSPDVMTPFTLVLLNHRRRANLARILDAVAAQSAPPVTFVWNNDPGERFEDGRVAWAVDSTTNRYCWPRWWMASFAQTPLLAVMDDDLCFTDERFFERLSAYMDESVGDGTVIGPEGVRLGADAGYYPRAPGPVEVRAVCETHAGPAHFAAPWNDEPVDVVKGRFMALRTCALDRVPARPAYRDVCDDLVISALVAPGRRRAHLVPSWLGAEFVDLPGKDGEMALSTQPWFRPRREEAARYYFFNDGVGEERR